MAYSIMLAGQDITLYCDQQTIKIDDTLGQGSGAGNGTSPQGRASTLTVDTRLGPMNTAYGAGQTLPGGGPYLVRQGEIVITDASGVRVFGGYVTKYTDTSTQLGPTRVSTTIEAIDYSTSLQRVTVDEIFSTQTDVQIINYVINKYAPWVSLAYMPTYGNYTFPVKNFRQVTLEQVLQTVAGVTGFLMWVDYYKNLHYVSPAQASAAPFNLSDTPDFLSTFTHAVEEFIVDDNSAINRVTFYGGNKQSGDIVQNVSGLATGSNNIFVFAAYPLPDSSGKVRASVNGVFQVIGIANGNHGSSDILKSQGGLADCLIDTNGPNLTFDVTPPSGATVLLYYRYNFPLAVRITDEASHKFYGNPYLDATLTDNTIYDTQTAVQRCKVLLQQQSFGLVTLKVIVYRPGLQSGMTIHITNAHRGINATYLIQQVTATHIGSGTFQFEVTCGAWNWNVVDVLVKMASLLNPPDLQNQGAIINVLIEGVTVGAAIHDTWTKTEHQHGVYYARSSYVGDGHDAFPGFCTISS